MNTHADDIAEPADPGSFSPDDLDLSSRDPLGYPGYRDSLRAAAERSGTDESVIAGSATIGGTSVELAVFNFSFMGGSMGEVAGERLARAMERASGRRVPFVLRTTTGGARMQEGMRSLIQMPKVVAARLVLAEAHQPFIAILGHPTTGGVLASLASLADITIAEEEATIGFAGPRVAERVTGHPLPPGSHTAAFAYDNGMLDVVIARGRVREWVADALHCLAPDRRESDAAPPAGAEPDRRNDAWETVEAARARKEAAIPYTSGLADTTIALEGDRAGGRAGDLAAEIARVDGRRLILLQPGDPLRAGELNKALRAVDIAIRLDIPVVSLVDTAGADPSMDSERHGIASLIARLTEKILSAPVPVLSVVTGEGGSGGALAFAAGDRLIAYESSYFSVIGPEAAAEILWRDASRAPEAARALRLTAADLVYLGIADEVVAGDPTAESLRRTVTYHLDRLAREPAHDRTVRRRSRWRDTW